MGDMINIEEVLEEISKTAASLLMGRGDWEESV